MFAVVMPSLNEVVLVCFLLALLGACWTVLKPHIAEPFNTIISIVAAFGLIAWVLHLFGVW